MSDFDYIIVGAGSAGCVLANRLSADPSTRVLLIEAGRRDRTPLIRIPRGFGKLLGSPTYAWHFPTEPFGKYGTFESWTRGKTLGGSSAINGLVYNRGHRADWDALEELGNKGWNWQRILASYKEIEDHQLGASPMRGAGGPLPISRAPTPDPLCERLIDAGASIGMERVEDPNGSDDERIGHTLATMRRGRRVSSAHAFLHPAWKSRPNLRVEVNALATRVLFEGDRAAGIRVRRGSRAVDYRASREVILCLGSIGTPKLLQSSGIGPADVLRAAGLEVRIDQPRVGAGMREHRVFRLQVRLRKDEGYNRRLATPLAQVLTGIQYLTTHRGPLASPSYDVIGFMKSDPSQVRVDAQVLLCPLSLGEGGPGQNPDVEREPGLQAIGYMLRPTSEGTVHVTGADPDAPLRIAPNYLDTPEDRQAGVALFRRMREMFASDVLASVIDHETTPGASIDDDEEILDHVTEHGYCGYHAVGTCAMGTTEDYVVDPQLRVRGVRGLRVMDCSVLPTMVAGNLNGPMMAMANVAAKLILDEPSP